MKKLIPFSQERNSGLSLLEILISLMILAMVMTGLANVFTVSRRYLNHSRSRVGGSEMGKLALSPLGLAVREDTYPSGELAENANKAGASMEIDGVTYNVTYNISSIDLPSDGILRRVNTTITWNEPAL